MMSGVAMGINLWLPSRQNGSIRTRIAILDQNHDWTASMPRHASCPWLGHRGRLPAYQHALDDTDGEKKQHGEGRAHNHGCVEHGGVEGVHRLDDQCADAKSRADPFADYGADHRGRSRDLESGEEVRQRVLQSQLEENFGFGS